MLKFILIILDGVGLRDEKEGNAVVQAHTPNLDQMLSECPVSNIETSGKWSSGTIAVLNQKSVEDKKNFFIKELSMMELEHLKTRASIPYRDPNLDYTSAQILKIREKEQLESNLLPTELWRKKWYMTNDPFNS